MILLAATPIGNPKDASVRLREAIVEADIVAAEDTRRFRGLCSRLELAPAVKVISLNDTNEDDKASYLIQQAQEGKTILVVSDAGTPTVSDPGFRLVTLANAAGVRCVPLPGPSAALAALSVSGLPTDRFVFEGFLPRKSSELATTLRRLATEPRTLIFFESPRRTATTLTALAEYFGESRPAALCRELTKTYEEVLRSSLGELAEYATKLEVLGEVTLVVGGHDSAPVAGPEVGVPGELTLRDLAHRALDLAEAQGIRLKEAAAQVAQQTGTRKNDLMEAALELRK